MRSQRIRLYDEECLVGDGKYELLRTMTITRAKESSRTIHTNPTKHQAVEERHSQYQQSQAWFAVCEARYS